MPRLLAVYQEEIEQIVARSRLSKQGLTVPRLELFAGHMAVNLLANVRDALNGLPVNSTHCWLDSSVALYWIRGQGEYKQFVSNRVQKINSHKDVKWCHVPTADNRADLGSRGGHVEGVEHWWNGPEWLRDPEQWPADVLNEPSSESQAEAKIIRELLKVTVETSDELDQMLQKWNLWKTVRVGSWVVRFIQNCRRKREQRVSGPITTEETNKQIEFWVRRAQVTCQSSAKFQDDKLQFNL